jgi:HAD superfamily hydrolase (TIGR01509 family)
VFPATLFDYNGVLADDESVHLATFRAVLAPLGIELTDKDYWEQYLGYDDAGAFRAILTNSGRPAPDELVRELIERKGPLYLDMARAGLVTFPGAGRTIELCAAAGPVGIVSGALRDEIELGLDLLGQRQHVRFIVSAEDTRACKPDPEGYLIGKQRLAEGLPSELAARALVIEDSLAGVEAAKRAGLTCLAVAHSYTEDMLRAAGADLVVPNIGALETQVLAELYRRMHA